jgi:hypothetical protein
MSTVIKTRVVLHNLIIDYEHAHNIDPGYIHNAEYVPKHPFTIIPRSIEQTYDERVDMINDMKNTDAHNRLQHVLMIQMLETWNLGDNGNELLEDDNGNELLGQDENEEL